MVKHALATFTTLDALIINHGVLEPLTRIADSSAESWRSLYDINLFSAIALVCFFFYLHFPSLSPNPHIILILSSMILTSIPITTRHSRPHYFVF